MVDTASVLSQDVISWFDNMITLNGIEITYKRFESDTYDPDTGNAIVYDEADIDAVLAPIRTYEVTQDSRLQQDDRKLIFKQSNFPYTSSGGVDKPTTKDKIAIDGDTWDLDLDGEIMYETDDTNTLYFIYVRK